MTSTPSSSPASRRRQAAAAATARRKLAKRALHVGNVLLLLLTADWVLQQPGIEAHRVATVSAYMLQGAGALLLAAEWLPGAVAVFTPADTGKLTTGKRTCLNENRNSAGACPTFAGTPPVSGQGSGTNGAWNDWDTSLVTDMSYGECIARSWDHGGA